jgi:hypothetical protein
LYFARKIAHQPNFSLYKPEDSAKHLPWVGYFHHAREVSLHQLDRLAFYDHFPAVTALPKRGDDWTRHPYLMCIFLSMAQSQRLHIQPTPAEFVSRLFVTDDQDAEFLHMFEAAIPLQLLLMIDRPNIALEFASGPTIKHKEIPFRPAKRFKDRVIIEASTLPDE